MILALVSLVGRIAGANDLFERLDGPHWWAELIWWNVLVPLGVISFATVGALIIAREPSNRIGWLAVTLATLGAFHDVVWQYAIRAMLLDPGSLPLAGLAVWLANAVSPAMLVLVFALVLLYFPNGCLVHESWRAVVWIALALALLNVASSTMHSVSDGMIDTERPSALTVDLSIGLAGWIHGLVEFATGIVLLLAVLSVFVRWHGSRGVLRQQLKWLGYVGAVMGASLLVWLVAVSLTADSYLSLTVLSVNLATVTIGVPSAIGIAILRYRLFDIDLVINRTLVYATLTVLLGSGYAASVLLLQHLFGRFLGGQDLAIVLATLMAVAAVRPARDRIQQGVDRYFFRQRYDAADTLARLSRSLQDEVDIERLQRALTRMIRETLQPRSTTIWLLDANPNARDSKFDPTIGPLDDRNQNE